jgi:putative membrane protein
MLRFVRFATPLAFALVIAGCNNRNASETANTAVADVDNLASVTGNAISNAADNVKEAVTSTPTGRQFADTAAKSDAFEIAAAKLAKEKAASKDIKSFAAMMIEDHTGSTAKIKKAAASADPKITPDPTLTDSQNGKLDDLKKLSGGDFDKEYASQQVDAHQSALALMRDYADHGEVAALKAAAGEIQPKVQEHLDKIKAIRDKL